MEKYKPRQHPAELKRQARVNYNERQLNKWVNWSWNLRGRVLWKELIEQCKINKL